MTGNIGLLVFSRDRSAILPFIAAGKSSTAEHYYEKVIPLLPAPEHLFFCCTDGAANMVKFGELIQVRNNILNVLCVAHGFSLLCHYFGTAIECERTLFDKLAGIVAFFNRSPQRMQHLRDKQAGKALNFVKISRTRFAYQIFVALRVIRLRPAARLALTGISVSKEEEGIQLEPCSKHAVVAASLYDDDLFATAEMFVRIAYPVMLVMKEFDSGLPMAGFVYWAFLCIEAQAQKLLDKICENDSSYAQLRDEVLGSIALLWDKRHSPVYSFAYLTNPLFHTQLRKDGSPWSIADHFLDDVTLVLTTMAKKRFGETKTEAELSDHIVAVLAQMNKYFERPLTALQVSAAKLQLASCWWSGVFSLHFSELAYYAARVHATQVVSCKLERFFSIVGNMTGKLRNSLSDERASRFAVAHEHMVSSSREGLDMDAAQASILRFVTHMQTLLDSEEVPDIDELGMSSVETWFENLANTREETSAESASEPFEAPNSIQAEVDEAKRERAEKIATIMACRDLDDEAKQQAIEKLSSIKRKRTPKIIN